MSEEKKKFEEYDIIENDEIISGHQTVKIKDEVFYIKDDLLDFVSIDKPIKYIFNAETGYKTNLPQKSKITGLYEDVPFDFNESRNKKLELKRISFFAKTSKIVSLIYKNKYIKTNTQYAKISITETVDPEWRYRVTFDHSIDDSPIDPFYSLEYFETLSEELEIKETNELVKYTIDNYFNIEISIPSEEFREIAKKCVNFKSKIYLRICANVFHEKMDYDFSHIAGGNEIAVPFWREKKYFYKHFLSDYSIVGIDGNPELDREMEWQSLVVTNKLKKIQAAFDDLNELVIRRTENKNKQYFIFITVLLLIIIFQRM